MITNPARLIPAYLVSVTIDPHRCYVIGCWDMDPRPAHHRTFGPCYACTAHRPERAAMHVEPDDRQAPGTQGTQGTHRAPLQPPPAPVDPAGPGEYADAPTTLQDAPPRLTWSEQIAATRRKEQPARVDI